MQCVYWNRLVEHAHLRITACLYYRSNCTESICFDSIQLQEYVYTSCSELDQFNLGSICGTTFARVVHITQLFVRSSLIRFDSSTTVRGGTIRIEAVRFNSPLHYE